MFKSTKRGSVAVETAIILPLVILGILTVAYLIKINSINENIMSISIDEVKVLNIESYTPLGKLNSFEFPKTLRTRIEEENENCASIEIDKFRYLYSYKELDNLISFNVDYIIDCNLPMSFYKPMYGRERVVTRAFVGSDNYNQDRGFAPMEENELSEPVWIFPVSGKKYHKENCAYIKVAASETRLTPSIKKRYKPCSLCDSQDIKSGSTVYCFFQSGNSYHRVSCSTVDRYVTEIEKSEALKRGYTPCLKCGGS